MPEVPDGMDWDLEARGSRFSTRPALGLAFPEDKWPASDDAWAELIADEYGAWILDDDSELGHPALIHGGYGRGAEGPLPVIEWLVDPVIKGVVSAIAAEAVRRVWRRARSGKDDTSETDGADAVKWVLVNRGTAILLAAAAVRDTFDVEGDLVLEAAEEPSAIAGRPIHELNYVGLEPWIVLLRSADARTRFLIVVGPRGEIFACVETPMDEFESHYFDPTFDPVAE